jgi:protein O-GlcNAc transferase
MRAFLKSVLSPRPNLFDRVGLAPVLDTINIVSLDIGARGGAQADLLPIARIVDLYGFEPDPAEFARLQKQKSGPWKCFTPLPYALGPGSSTARLNLYSKLGCSSLLRADAAKAARFSRSDYYEPIGGADIKMESLDDLIAQNILPAPDHIKIDVQGFEMEVFKGAQHALKGALALRTEVCFYDIYENQPLFADIDSFLRKAGFVFMGFTEMHAWRRRTKIKWPRRAPGPIPYSKGQLMHADVLYMRMPEDMPHATQDDKKNLIKLGLLAAAYGYIDHAAICFRISGMKNPDSALTRLSRRIMK